MKAVYQTRTKAIQHCIAETTAAIDDLRTQRAASPDDSGVTKQLRKEQNKVSHAGRRRCNVVKLCLWRAAEDDAE